MVGCESSSLPCSGRIPRESERIPTRRNKQSKRLLFRLITKVVNKKKCTCSCWDTVFKGRYEMGVAGYKNVYFNCTYNTYMMWALTLLFLFMLYESLKHILACLMNKCARKKIVLIFLSSIYPNYYGWWMYFNYYNDEFYDQWWHQTFFTITELVSTFAILMLVNEHNTKYVSRKLLVIQRYVHFLLISCIIFVNFMFKFFSVLFLIPNYLLGRQKWIQFLKLKDSKK